MLTDFQCDIFHFRQIKDRSLERTNQKNQNLLVTIRIELLDELWIRELGTNQGNIYMLSKITVFCQRGIRLGIVDSPVGSLPVER